MFIVKFKQEEADFLLEEFGVEVDSNLQYTFTREQAIKIQDECLEIEVEGLPENDEVISERGQIAGDVYNAILYAKREQKIV